MKLTIQEIQVLQWAAAYLEERAEKVESFFNLENSFRHEAAIIRGIVERGKNEAKESD